MIFKVISHFILNKSYHIRIIKIIYSENLAKKEVSSAEKTDFLEFSGTLSEFWLYVIAIK